MRTRGPDPNWTLTAAAVVVGSLFLRWFTATLADLEIPGHRTGWQWLGVLDWILVAAAVAAVLTAVLVWRRAAAAEQAVWVLRGLVVLGALGVFYRIVSPPDDARPGFVTEVSVSAGPWVALLGLAVLGLATVTSGARSGRD